MKNQKNRLPSGKYRVRVRYKDDNGVEHQKSFSAATKAEANVHAEQWKKELERKQRGDITLSEAINGYISIKAGVLSPSTVKGYESIYRTHLEDTPIGRQPILDPALQPRLQAWFSNLARSLSPKTLRNIYGLIKAALDMYLPDNRIKITLPQRLEPDTYCPTSKEVNRLIMAARERNDSDMELAIELAAFGTLRRSEILALTDKDISGNTVSVSKAMIEGDDGVVIKIPKTPDSKRKVELPPETIALTKGREGHLIKLSLPALDGRFRKIAESVGLSHVRFHDLRHYSASIMHAVGVPDQYIMARGGWKTDNVMKSVYRNVISDEYVAQTKKINAYFSSVIAINS